MNNNISKKPLLILVGGLGSRLGELVNTTPKPMLELNGRPFLCYLIDHYYNCGIREFYLLTSYLSEIIENYFEENKSLLPDDISIKIIKEKTPLGTGGSIKSALTEITHDEFFATNGDTFVDVDINELYQLGSPSLIVSRQEDISRYGEVILTGSVVTAFKEKSEQRTAGLINAGIYFLNKSLFNLIEKTSFSLERDLLENFLPNLNLKAIKTQNYFVDIGIPEDYERAKKDLAKE